MGNEIEEFLRRIAKQKMQAQQAERQDNMDEVLDAVVVDPGVEVISVEPEVDAYVESHLDSSSIGNRTSGLGDKIDQRDDRMEEHVHEVFDHELGALDSSTDQPGNEPPQAPEMSNITRMLSQPQLLRDAILLQEVLGPPVSERDRRW